MTSKYTVDIDPEAETSHGLIIRLVGESKKVLDIGCAAGDLARVLVERGCEVSGIEVDAAAADAARSALNKLVIGDITELDLATEFEGEEFDVVVLGDVLEHLVNPAAALRQAKAVLRPGGHVVISVPNMSHASVRLAMARGEFTYTPVGLLDETHLRFFTRRSLYELLASESMVAHKVLRTVTAPFGTELGLEAQDFPDDLVNLVTVDEDATSYQFVLTASPAEAETAMTWLENELDKLDRVAADVQERFDQRGRELSSLRRELLATQKRLGEAERDVSRLEGEVRAAERAREADRELLDTETRATIWQEAELERANLDLVAAHAAAELAHEQVQAMLQSTSWRLSAPIRALAPLKGARRGIGSGRPQLLTRGNFRRVVRRLHEEGVRSTARAIQDSLQDRDKEDEYVRWLEAHGTLSHSDREAIRCHIAELPRQPLISVIMPAYNTDDEALRAALDSVMAQLYDAWELCVVDDASSRPSVWATLNEYAGRDERIRVRRRVENGGIAAATNDAIALASGEYLALLDHDDVLAPHALYMVAAELAAHPGADLIYTDEDKLDGSGRRYEPYFKPDFNHELLLGQNMVSHLGVYRTELVREIGGMRADLDGSQDHDLTLRVVAATSRECIRHIPFVLYHWRQYPNSGTFSSSNLESATAASRIAVRDHLAQLGDPAEVMPAPAAGNWNRVVWPVAEVGQPEVAVVIPTRDRVELLRPCVEGVLEKTDYKAIRVIVVDNGSTDASTLSYLDRLERDARIEVLRAPGPFNYSALNNRAVYAVDSPLVLLLNNDIVVRDPGWLKEMVSLAQRPGVGIVGAKLLYPDGRVQHAGVLLGVGGVAGHAHLFRPGDGSGYFGRLALVQEFSAVTGACLLTRREVFEEVGGLDEENLRVAFNDVDYCLRVREAGYRVLWTPHAELTHAESASRGRDTSGESRKRFEREAAYMRWKWGDSIQDDPAYNPNLSLTVPDFAIDQDPRVDRPWEPYLT